MIPQKCAGMLARLCAVAARKTETRRPGFLCGGCDNGKIAVFGVQHKCVWRRRKEQPMVDLTLSLQAFVAAAGLTTSKLGGIDGIKVAAAEIYGIPLASIDEMALAIKAINKRDRWRKCKFYRRAHKLKSPKAKGQIRRMVRNKIEKRKVRNLPS